MLKLHLGCGEKVLDGFLNCDMHPFNEKVKKCDIKKLDFIKNETVDLIYACHVLEHVKRHEVIGVLKEWNRVLKKGGELYVAVPDFNAIVEHYNENKNLTILQGLLNGGQTYLGNEHYVSFDFDFISNCLKESGFDKVSKYDWKKTEFSEFDDFSKAYLPHMDIKNGKLMSLNVLAKKI